MWLCFSGSSGSAAVAVASSSCCFSAAVVDVDVAVVLLFVCLFFYRDVLCLAALSSAKVHFLPFSLSL